MNHRAAGTDVGQRRLIGPQNSGRQYRNLSEVGYRLIRDDDVKVALRDGAQLLADVYRPQGDGRFPALLSASPYPRQLQDSQAPMGFVEAGASDFFVPRGYGHVIANLRGTGGSDGEFGLFDAVERHDLYDLVEWVAAQPWCDGNVGMIGISYFAMTQLEAAVERPPHLKAVFPFDITTDLYEAAYHNGLFSSTFITPWLASVGICAGHGDDLWRGKLLDAARRVLAAPKVHSRFEHLNGESAAGALKLIMRAGYDPHPWDDLWQAVAIEHPVRDEFWDNRNLLPDLDQIDIPVYLGGAWDNVPLHLRGAFSTWAALAANPQVRMTILGRFGLTWPWESLHVEALAWFDHWLKDRDTGILEGPPVRYWLPGAEEWRTATSWPPACQYLELALNADRRLAPREQPGSRDYVCVGQGMDRPPGASPLPLPAVLYWASDPLADDLDVVGDIELQLSATTTAADTAWIVVIQDVGPDGAVTDVTAGWLRASLREVDDAASRPGAPILPCRHAQAVPPGERVDYRIPLVPNARRFAKDHQIRLMITSDDRSREIPAVLGFRHAPVGTSARNTIHSSSRLFLPTVSPSPETLQEAAPRSRPGQTSSRH